MAQHFSRDFHFQMPGEFQVPGVFLKKNARRNDYPPGVGIVESSRADRPDQPISIWRGLTTSAFGTTTFSTPLSNDARILSASTAVGKVKLRWNRP